MKKEILVLLISFAAITVFGQFKHMDDDIGTDHIQINEISEVLDVKTSQESNNPPILHQDFSFNTFSSAKIEKAQISNFTPHWTAKRNIPVAIYGSATLTVNEDESIQDICYKYLESISDLLGVEDVKNRFFIQQIETDELGITHIRLKQYYYGIPIYGGEIMVHIKNNAPYFMNGYWYPEEPVTIGEMESRGKIDPKEIVENDLGNLVDYRDLSVLEQKLIGTDQWELEKVYFKADEEDDLALCWRVTVHPNLGEEWTYLIDERNGDIKRKYQEICKLHDHKELKKSNPGVLGGEKAWATDLQGNSREINVYNHGGQYYLIDASRNMFQNNQSTMPNDPIGVIWTLNAQGTSPENDNFNVEHIESSNNSWSNKTAVSAHYNAEKAYEYYKNTFNRNSINGSGGNIISLINVVNGDGTQMDNAFWSGKAMFYGNGNDAFYPLAGSLDVAGHEMTHGVIQSTANLEYYGESGAINESFADVFGCMIDREDWKLGEDVVFTNVFTSGALRDMSNPHNGGSSLNDNGYQPAHTNEQYTGSQDNGGVHINSGIPNYAYYKFATAIGKDKAEQIYYKALTSYLTKSSKFVDLRVAIEQAAYDLYGADFKTAASNAFDAVGISGGSTGGGNNNNYQDDLEVNPGNDLILYYDDWYQNLVLATPDGNKLADPLSNTRIISKPSISDNGTEIVFVGEDKKIHYIYIDWASGEFNEDILQSDPIWRNVIISKDGWRMAALTESLDNQIHVYDFGIQSWNAFELYNPSTAEGITAGAIDFADVMEFNYSGEWIMYDARNTINSEFGNDIEYWDIGFVEVFNNQTGNFTEGLVQKLFSGLPENTSIGNPTFSKNSPYIIAFDYLVGENGYYIVGSNLETGAVNEIYENLSLSYPNYSRLDDQMVFDYSSFFGNDVAILDVGADKISLVQNSDKILFEGATWATWFANGTRDLSLDDGFKLVNTSESLVIQPNPARDQIHISGVNLKGNYRCDIVDLLGNMFYSDELDLKSGSTDLAINHLPTGSYILTLRNHKEVLSKKIMIAD